MAAFQLVDCVCASCGVVFLSTRPTEQEIGQYYAKDYQPYLGQYLPIVEKMIARRTKKEIAQFNKLNAHIENVLEVGCSYGSYLNDLKRFGTYKSFTGVEMDAECCRKASDLFGLQVLNGTLETVKFDSERFDLVVMNHVIEHVYHPVETLEEIRRIMKPGGLLMIKTPNTRTVEKTVFGRYWLPYEAPRHVTIFSLKTLRKVLEQRGFKIVKVYFEKTPNNIILSIKNYLIEKKSPKRTIDFFSLNNPLLLALFTPRL